MELNTKMASDAVQKLIKDWYVPAFMTKLAEYGIKTDDPDTVQKLFSMAATLATLNEYGRIQKENAEANALKAAVKTAADDLAALVSGKTIQKQNKELVDAAVCRNAVVDDPELRKAALIYGYLTSGGKVGD